MIYVVTTIHVIACLFLVIVVLLQSGKAADLAGAFGGMGSQTAFGPRGSATVLSKATTIAAGLFMLTSLTLAVMATRNTGRGTSVLEQQQGATKTPVTPAPVTTTAPAAPVQTSPAPVRLGTGEAQPGQPSVTFTSPGGASKTVPIELPAQPGGQPAQPPPPKK